MDSTVEMVGANRAKLTLVIPPETLEAGLDRAYKKNRAKYSVPGFRKGKAPRAIIENYYGELVFFDEAFDEVFPEEYIKAIKKEGVDAVSRPDVDITSVSRQEGIVCSAEVDVRPKVELGEYLGLNVEITKHELSEADVDAEIEKMREENCGFEEADRPARLGDRVVIDYAGSVDGVPFEGGAAENQTLELGSNTFIPGFEDQVAGMSKGEEKEINVTFPEGYHAKELSGKEAVFKVKVNEVKVKELPEADDEFAKDVSEFETLAQLRDDIKKRLSEQLEKNKRYFIEDRAVEAACENVSVDIPKSMIDAQIDRQIEEFAYSLMYQGIKLEDYLKYLNITIDDMREQNRERAAKMVKSSLVIDAVIEKEGIEATEEQVDEEIVTLAARAKKEPAEYKKTLSDDMLKEIRDSIKFRQAIKLMADSAKVTEVSPAKTDGEGEAAPGAKND